MRHHALGVIARLLCLSLTLLCAQAQAQRLGRAVQNVDVQKLANGVLGIMSYTVAPDVTTSSLSVNNSSTSSSDLFLTQFGGGFTWSKGTPLYLEGNAAYARYDPIFATSDGTENRSLPVQWNSVSATGGIGWDFPLSQHWVIRPIFSFMLGTVASDLRVARWWLESNTDVDLAFLDDGKMQAYGLGGALMLDYEKFTPEADDDLEIRYTNVNLYGYGDYEISKSARAKAESVSIWARRRTPTGWVALDRPVRYVYEAAYTRFLGAEKDVGLTQMSSL
ncbi:MAG TPA: autotransporter domain-containing protein, partial [Rhizobacter sp.]|nr:autotransporter domain-containing protein [Rhizobacter sp.]